MTVLLNPSETVESELFHKFSWPGKTNTTERDALDLIGYCSNLSHTSSAIGSAKDQDGWTLTHHACYKGWFEVVRILIQDYKADPHCLNNFRCTPLHWAAFGGHCNIVRYLVIELNCDPNAENRRGNTPLQIACWRGHLEVIKFLILECKCDPLKPNNNNLTPFEESLICNHIHVVSFLLSTGLIDKLIRNDLKVPKLLSDWYYKLFKTIIDFRKSNPLKPTLKVFFLGDTGVGKTTLVRAVKNKLCSSRLSTLGGRYRHVPPVAPHTSGVIPTRINSSASGPMTLFDFAGHQEFYCSHAALLENLNSSQGSVLLVLLDLTEPEFELKTSLESWMSFLDSVYSFNNRPPSIVIGSHSDVLKQRGEQPIRKLQSVCNMAGLSDWDINCTQLVMNCTKVSSHGLNILTDQLYQCLCKYHASFNVAAQTHVVNAIIKEHFRNSIGCQIREVVELLEQQSEGLFEYNLLPSPSDDKTLSQQINILSDLGEIVYLQSDDFRDGWIIFDKNFLFSKVNGTIFSPHNFPSKYFANSTGVISKRNLCEMFKGHDIEMIKKFLTHFKYCYEIPASAEHFELYFFPHLVNNSKQDLGYFDDCSYTCKWQLRCQKRYQFFSSRLTQSIIVELATIFGLTPDGIDEADSCPVILKECNVWNSGIHWKDMDGVEVVVEFDESYKIVLLEMGSLKGAEIELVKLRSRIIKLILQIKNCCSKDIETSESFVYPANLNGPSLCNSYEYSKDRVCLAATNNKEYVTSKHDTAIKQVSLKQLLYMEPLHLLPIEVVAQIFRTANADAPVNHVLMEELQIILKEDYSGFLTSILKPNVCIKDIRESIEKHSIFSNLKILLQGDSEDSVIDLKRGKFNIKDLQLLDGTSIRILETVAPNWEEIAIAIGLNFTDIQIIAGEYPRDVNRACLQVFGYWLSDECPPNHKFPPSTWGALLDVLCHAGFEYIASQIKEVLGIIP